MLVMRPAQAADLPQVQRLAADSPVGVTSLPDDAERLRDKIRAIAESQNLVLAVGTPGDDAEPYLIHNRKREDCRITAAPARAAAGTLVVDPLTAKRLRLSAGASVRAVPLSAQKRG